MVMGMPPRITADTGMDALTHAIESYVTPWRTPFTDGPALIAVDFIFRYLRKACENGRDEEARKYMMYAASQAGTAICNCNGGLAHSAGHSLGGIFHTPHGRAVGLFLPYTMEYSASGSQETAGRYADIARYCNISRDADDKKCSAALIAAVRNLAKSIGQPLSVRDLGIKREDFIAHADGLLDRAVNDAMTLGATRAPDDPDMAKIFSYAYDGKTVDF
jgi:alcohol dehydrogenase class IV